MLAYGIYWIRFLLQGIFTSEELQRYSKRFLCGLYVMAHGNLNNSMKAFDVFFKMSVQKHMKDRHLDIKQQMKLFKLLYKKGLLKEIH